MRIAVLGLGRMGIAVATRLQEGGHELKVWNRSSGRAKDLVANGATEAVSPKEAAAGAEVVISSLANDDAVRDVTTGSQGVLREIGQRTYVDASTISTALSAELADTSKHFVAMPILGAPQAVREGKATYLAGGVAGRLDALTPVLESLGGPVKHYDRPVMATAAKLAVNLLLLSGIVTVAEALTVGRSGGLSDDQLGDLLGTSPMLAAGLKNRLEGIIDGAGPTWWTTTLAAKDARLAGEAAKGSAKDLPIAAAVQEAFQAAVDSGYGSEDIIAVANLYRAG